MRERLAGVFNLSEFLHRCFVKRYSIAMTGILFGGILLGSVLACVFDIFSGKSLFPMFFSDMPKMGEGFFSSFAGILLRTLMFELLVFFFSITMFGGFLIPMAVIFRGVTIGVGMMSFFFDGEPFPLLRGAVGYAPICSITVFFFILLASRAMAFSDMLSKAAFSVQTERVSLSGYMRDLSFFVVFAVLTSAFAGALVSINSLFFL